MRAPVTCSACGAIGHVAGGDGLCSATHLARLDVAAGMVPAEAARRHGILPNNLYRRFPERDPHALRREVIRSRVDTPRRQATGRIAMLSAAWTTYLVDGPLDRPPEVCDPPRLDTAGADHAEISDPPALLEVGWRTSRARRPSDS